MTEIAARLDALVDRHLAGRPRAFDLTLVGLVGRGIQASRTPFMHEREAARQGLPYAYLLLDFDALGLADAALGAVLDAAEATGFRGLNVTHPFKQAVLAHLDALAGDARAIGAVNTVVFEDGRRMGHNTDAPGFAHGFRAGLAEAPLAHVVQLGAGGAGAAVASALVGLGVQDLVLIDPAPGRAGELARRLGPRVRVGEDVTLELAAADGVVNTTPIGMASHPGLPLPAEALLPRHWVADVVYFPLETALLRHARNLGCRTLAGSSMAIGQAALAFEAFTGRPADRQALEAHFEAAS